MEGRDALDLICIRIDAADAVADFLELLAAQAAEGETRAPANPANRAIYRELAPFRLMEYEYVEDEIGAVDGAYIGFPDGTLFAAGEEIPEPAVDRMIEDGAASGIEALYVYVVLARPAPADAVRRYVHALADQIGHPLVAVLGGEAGLYGAAEVEESRGQAWLARAAAETSRHLDAKAVSAAMGRRSLGPHGEAYAAVTWNFARHLLEFPSTEARDDFVAWTRRLCDWMYDADWCAIGFHEVVRPAEPVGLPEPDARPARADPPSAHANGAAWSAFEGEDREKALASALDYWEHVKRAVRAAEG